jgi:phosphoribosylaminoimidazolecarboxamide formyltransferase/IMP cyclohydrolase
MDLRYGENPHQKAAFFKLEGMHGLPSLIQRHGKELSFNNLVDIEAAWAIVRELELCGAVIIKHTNPCGAAVSETISSAYKRAHDADAVSAFGSVVGLNRRVDRQTAEQIASTFVEVVVAPGFDADALQILGQKAAIRLVEIPEFNPGSEEFVFKYVSGGFLLQTPDDRKIAAQDFNVVTKRKPTEREINDLVFAFRLVKFIKSNAILIAKDGQSLGVGAGQMSRVEAVELAIKKAGARTEGAVLASDAFFPFKDSVVLAANANIKAIVQPGGSKRDQESIDCCDAHGIAMVFTSVRHFRH